MGGLGQGGSRDADAAWSARVPARATSCAPQPGRDRPCHDGNGDGAAQARSESRRRQAAQDVRRQEAQLFGRLVHGGHADHGDGPGAGVQRARHLRPGHLQREQPHAADRHAPRRRRPQARHRALLHDRELAGHDRWAWWWAACLALAAGFWLSTQYQLPRLDLYYLVGGVLGLWAVGQLAAWQPSLRAAKVSPAMATRNV